MQHILQRVTQRWRQRCVARWRDHVTRCGLSWNVAKSIIRFNVSCHLQGKKTFCCIASRKEGMSRAILFSATCLATLQVARILLVHLSGVAFDWSRLEPVTGFDEWLRGKEGTVRLEVPSTGEPVPVIPDESPLGWTTWNGEIYI